MELANSSSQMTGKDTMTVTMTFERVYPSDWRGGCHGCHFNELHTDFSLCRCVLDQDYYDNRTKDCHILKTRNTKRIVESEA